jgi:hypothetical protein
MLLDWCIWRKGNQYRCAGLTKAFEWKAIERGKRLSQIYRKSFDISHLGDTRSMVAEMSTAAEKGIFLSAEYQKSVEL